MPLPATDGKLVATFATAVMNGCAFYVFGTPTNPTVCHLNVASFISDLKCYMLGIRRSGQWTFFYQRSIFTLTYAMDKLGWTGGIQKKLFGDHRVRTPIQVHQQAGGSQYVQFWP